MAEGFVIVSDTLTPGLAAFPERTDRAVGEIVEFMRPTVEGYARATAPWTDRTGNARQGLHATTFHEPPIRHGIELAHGVPYGIWLEVRFSGKYQIIVPTIKTQGAAMMALLRSLLQKLH